MKRLVVFIAISLLSSIANAGTLTLQDCKDAVANSKKEVKFPSTLDELTEFTDMKCGAELYLGKPTYEYYYKTTKATKNQLRPDFQATAKTAIFNDTCIKSFNSLSEYANRKYIYTDSNNERITEVLISSDECIQTPAGRLAVKVSAQPAQLVDKNDPLRIYKYGAVAGNPASQTSLAKMYQIGQAVPQDSSEALRWYRLAANQNFAEAQYELGMMYENGQGVERNHTEALILFKKAAAQDFKKAKKVIGFDTESKSEVSQAQYLEQLSRYRDANLQREYDETKKIEKVKQDEANLRLIDDAKRQKEIQILEAKRQKDIEDALAKKDDVTCKSYGAKKGSPAYVQCRSTQVANRQEAADRQKTIDALEKRINILQTQIQSQSEAQSSAQSQARERDRRLSAEQYASDQEFKNKQIELQQEQLRTLQQQQAQAREAARWEAIRQMNDPAQWNQKAPPLPQPVTPHRYNCYSNGAYTTCQ